MSKQRHRQPRDAAPPRGPQWAYASLLASSSAGAAGQAPCPEVPAPEPPLPREDAMLGITDAIAKEIDLTWVIIAVIEILLRESSSDKYAQGGLRLAHAHLDGLCAIQRDIDRVWRSE